MQWLFFTQLHDEVNADIQLMSISFGPKYVEMKLLLLIQAQHHQRARGNILMHAGSSLPKTVDHNSAAMEQNDQAQARKLLQPLLDSRNASNAEGSNHSGSAPSPQKIPVTFRAAAFALNALQHPMPKVCKYSAEMLGSLNALVEGQLVEALPCIP